MGNLEEMDKFLEIYKLPCLIMEEIEIIKGKITNTEIKTDSKSSNKVKDQMASQAFSIKHIEKS